MAHPQSFCVEMYHEIMLETHIVHAQYSFQSILLRTLSINRHINTAKDKTKAELL